MKPEQFQREKDYGAALAIAGILYKRGQITAVEHSKIKATLIKKYCPVIARLHGNNYYCSVPQSTQPKIERR